MDFIIVGAGAVGAVVGTLLEHAGHTVRYWARTGQPKSTRPFEISRDGGPKHTSQPLRWIDAETSPMPVSDWVLVLVRTEQLSAALNQVVTHLGADRAVAVGTVTLDGALESASKAGLRGPVVAFHVSFGSGFTSDRELSWFPFTPPSTISAEGQPDMRDPARALAETLAGAGLPARSLLDMGGMMHFMVMSNIALLPSWELCQWDIGKLARDSELRWLTARAMCETAREFPPETGLGRWLARGTPVAAYALVLRVLPQLMGTRARKLWLIHGPKIGDQTRYFLDELLDRAKHSGKQLTSLTQLISRWRADERIQQP